MLGSIFRRMFQAPFIKKCQNNNIVAGRWSLDYDDTIQNRKIYWANMDNCGCCDIKNNHQTTNKKIKNHDKKKKEDLEEYILPYII